MQFIIIIMFENLKLNSENKIIVKLFKGENICS